MSRDIEETHVYCKINKTQFHSEDRFYIFKNKNVELALFCGIFYLFSPSE